MVKIATKENGFAILVSDSVNSDNPTASWVDVVNFDTTSDGVLQIDVKCKALISLKNFKTDQQNLLWAEGESVDYWPTQKHNDETLLLNKLLLSLFEDNNEFAELYQQEYIDKPNWVVARWLELLPIKTQEKTHFFLADSYSNAVSFLSALLLDNNKLNDPI